MEQQEEAEGTQVVGWSLAAMLQEDEVQAEKLWKERAMGRAYLGEESTGDEVGSEAEWCQNALSSTRRRCQEDKDMCSVKEVVEWR